MFDVSKSYWYFFDEHAVFVVGRTKFVLFILLQKYTSNKVRVIMSKLKDFLVVVVGILISRKFIMLFDMDVGLGAVSPNCVGDILLD